MKRYSVIITHFHREVNLINTLHGLDVQSVLPSEVLVVDMGNGLQIKNDYRFDLKILDLDMKWTHMPLAAARNYGAENATTENLVFLDVDCIPSPEFCETLADLASLNGALVMGYPKYIVNNAAIGNGIRELGANSVPHPARPMIKTLRKEDCYELFWSLCFAITGELFEYVGGFDENYEGYGAEDTDFALEVKKAGVPFYLSASEVYHQQHPVYVPPLNHLKSIVRNCNYFYMKWGYWPMEDCLCDFAEMGFIDWLPEKEVPTLILSSPTETDIKKRLVKNAPYR